MGKEGAHGVNIHRAIQAGEQKAIRTFLKSCSARTINARDEKGQTPLHIACMNPESLPIVRRLLKKKALVNCSDVLGWTPLHIAAQYHCYEICKELIHAKANVHSLTENKNSVLSFLVKGDSPSPLRYSMLREILPEGLHDPNDQGETPFTLACMFGDVEIVELLLQHSPDVNTRT